MLHAEVFRPPRYPSLLCVLFGSGVQVLGMAVVTMGTGVDFFLSRDDGVFFLHSWGFGFRKLDNCDLNWLFGVFSFLLVFSVLGFVSPANQGSVITAMIVLYVWMGVLAGYASSRLYQLFKVLFNNFLILITLLLLFLYSSFTLPLLFNYFSTTLHLLFIYSSFTLLLLFKIFFNYSSFTLPLLIIYSSNHFFIF